MQPAVVGALPASRPPFGSWRRPASSPSRGWHYLDDACGYVGGDATGKSGSCVRAGLARPARLQLDRRDGRRHYSAANRRQPYRVAPNNRSTSGARISTPRTRPTGLCAGPMSNRGMGAFSFTLEPGRASTASPPRTASTRARPLLRSPPPFPSPTRTISRAGSAACRVISRTFFGSFEIAPALGGRPGTCLGQTTPQAPDRLEGNRSAPLHHDRQPGLDRLHRLLRRRCWKNRAQSICWPGSLACPGGDVPNSYLLRVTDSGAWSIAKSSIHAPERVLASGTIAPLGTNTWHRLSLACRGSKITACDRRPRSRINLRRVLREGDGWPWHRRLSPRPIRPFPDRTRAGGLIEARTAGQAGTDEFKSGFPKRSHGVVVSSPPSHGGCTGSNPVGTMFPSYW